MDLEGRKLAAQMSGGDVALLQRELAALGFGIPNNEFAAQTFGPGTEAAARQFQAQHNLPVTGVVDDATAAAINTTIGQANPPADYVARGQISGLPGNAPGAAV